MDRRKWLAVAGAGLCGGWTALIANRAAGAGESIDTEELSERLKKGLLLTRQDQKDYIDRVVVLVDQGKLDLALVYGLFKWARRKHRRYPYIYFRRALDEFAKKQGIVI